jgi:hypothetical protein
MPRVKDRSREVEENTPVLYCVKCRKWVGVTRQVCVSTTDSGKIWTCAGCSDVKVETQASVVSSNQAPTNATVAMGAPSRGKRVLTPEHLAKLRENAAKARAARKAKS